MTTTGQNAAGTSIDPGTKPGLLSLTVADLQRSVRFYTQAIGFSVLQQEDKATVLGVERTPLLLLTEHAGAQPWPHDRYGYTGLYHFALLVPTRAEQGRWLKHWLELGLPLPGQGDHLVSEAFYVADPDGNGIEVYHDRPRAEWSWVNGQIQMATNPVDIQGLLAEAERASGPWTGLSAGTCLGHMHLQIGDIAQGEAFYHRVLGFDITARMPTALFLSAGGYHHHIGMNVWHSRGAGPAPEGTAGLRFFTIDFLTEQARQAVIARIKSAGMMYRQIRDIVVVQDPWQNTLLLQVGAAADAQAAAVLASVASQK